MKLDVCDWLRAFLATGPKEVSEVRAAAKAAGYSRYELREAKLLCMVKSENNWSKDHPVTDKWYWSLPED